jgi:hypothetical protein
MDATQSDRFGNFKVHPVMVPSTFYSIKVRRLYCGWRLIGLVPDIYVGFSDTDRTRMRNKPGGTGYAVRNLHAMLHVILQEYIEIQKRGGILLDYLTINGVTKRNVLVIVPLHSMVLGDQEGNDALAGNTRHDANISRACYCPKAEASDMRHKCVWKTKQDMMDLVHNGGVTFGQQLQSCLTCSQVPVDNVFWKIEFMDDERSIHGSSPVCLLHLMLQGLFKYIGESIIEPLTRNGKGVLDDLCHYLIPMLRQSGVKNNFPHCQFKNGLTGLSQITADEREGTILVFLILFSLPRFNDVMQQEIFSKNPDRFPMGEVHTIRKNFAFVCELLLILYRWANGEQMSREFLKEQAESS